MIHLTVDELIGFVSVQTLDKDAMALTTRVTEHVRSCAACLRKLRAFQIVSQGMADGFGLNKDSLEAVKAAMAAKAELQESVDSTDSVGENKKQDTDCMCVKAQKEMQK